MVPKDIFIKKISEATNIIGPVIIPTIPPEPMVIN
jgi:hypothetical protein